MCTEFTSAVAPRMALLKRKHRGTFVFALFLFLFFIFHRSSGPSTAHELTVTPAAPVCPRSPLLDDILVVVRTGATEALEKLPIHFRTTLTCVPHYIIYSDFEEDIEGHHLHDVLQHVNPTIRNEVSEFKLYNQLRAKGREGLKYETVFGSGPAGASENPGWKLDKWKFLPMVERALSHRPKAKWFVFVEPDTYMVWPNTLEYLAQFDPNEVHYLGKHMFLSNVLFAHGGSGFALSAPAIQKVVKHLKDHKDELDQFTQKEWAGDMILGKALKDVGIELFWAFPHLQGDSLGTIDWNVSKIEREPWCYAPMTFHHMNKDEIGMLWNFEQAWHRRNHDKAILRFRDIFKGSIYPQLKPERSGWDNMSTGTEYSDEAIAKLSEKEKEALTLEEKEAKTSFEKCRAVCESKRSCVQYSYAAGKCSISNQLRLGYAAKSQCLEYSNAAGKCIKVASSEESDDPNSGTATSVWSGWLMERVLDYIQDLDESCANPEGNDWVTV